MRRSLLDIDELSMAHDWSLDYSGIPYLSTVGFRPTRVAAAPINTLFYRQQRFCLEERDQERNHENETRRKHRKANDDRHRDQPPVQLHPLKMSNCPSS
jgi:hypothetical protein